MIIILIIIMCTAHRTKSNRVFFLTTRDRVFAKAERTYYNNIADGFQCVFRVDFQRRSHVIRVYYIIIVYYDIIMTTAARRSEQVGARRSLVFIIRVLSAYRLRSSVYADCGPIYVNIIIYYLLFIYNILYCTFVGEISYSYAHILGRW